jgi:endo-1,4-beta-xylanase
MNQASTLIRRFAHAFEIGVAVEPSVLEDCGSIVRRHFNRLTAENAMKHSRLRPDDGPMQTAAADAIADFARANGMKVSGHTLLWHRMHGDWLFRDGNAPAARELVSERLAQHIEATVARYADVVDHWDVVNEAVSDSPGKTYRDGAEGSRWYETYGGPHYVKLAFELTAEVAKRYPTALYYNDYNVARPEKRAKVLELVRWLRAEGVQVDGVGVQAHWNLLWPTTDEISRTIDELVSEGLDVKISELDVSVYPEDDFPKERWQAERPYEAELEAQLARRYVEIFTALERHADSLSSVTLWGLCDDHSWLNTWPIERANYPLLFDGRHQPKLALRQLLEQ